MSDPRSIASLLDWVNERHAIYLRKMLLEGRPVPNWANPAGKDVVRAHYTLDHLTDDPVLHQFRFCNVFRELDSVTQWIHWNIRQPYADHQHLWIMLAIARYINWPPTLDFLIKEGAWPDRPNFTPTLLGKFLDTWKASGNKTYTGAYMIRAESDKSKEWYSWTKQQYVARIVIGRLWEERELWHTWLDDDPSLEQIWNCFQVPHYIGWGPFMAYEVVTDLRHTRYLRNAPDIMTWAAAGPGAIRGLNRLHGRDLGAPLTQPQACEEMRQLLRAMNQHKGRHVPEMEMRDIEHSLCEVDKWLRVKNHEGKPRALYVRGRGY